MELQHSQLILSDFYSALFFIYDFFIYDFFSFMISDSTNNGKIAEVLLGSWDSGYQNRFSLLPV